MAENDSINFRPIEGFPGYRVGDDGSVWSCWTKISNGKGTQSFIGDEWRLMKLGRQKDRGTEGRSYLSVRLSRNGRTKLFRIHRLVLEAFIGPCPEGMEGRHLDGDPANNRSTNLCWGTPTENAEDKRKHGHLGSNARYYTHDGKTLVLKDWSRLVGIPYLTLWNRLKTGMTIADAISIKRYDRKAITQAKAS